MLVDRRFGGAIPHLHVRSVLEILLRLIPLLLGDAVAVRKRNQREHHPRKGGKDLLVFTKHLFVRFPPLHDELPARSRTVLRDHVAPFASHHLTLGRQFPVPKLLRERKTFGHRYSGVQLLVEPSQLSLFAGNFRIEARIGVRLEGCVEQAVKVESSRFQERFRRLEGGFFYPS